MVFCDCDFSSANLGFSIGGVGLGGVGLGGVGLGSVGLDSLDSGQSVLLS